MAQAKPAAVLCCLEVKPDLDALAVNARLTESCTRCLPPCQRVEHQMRHSWRNSSACGKTGEPRIQKALKGQLPRQLPPNSLRFYCFKAEYEAFTEEVWYSPGNQACVRRLKALQSGGRGCARCSSVKVRSKAQLCPTAGLPLSRSFSSTAQKPAAACTLSASACAQCLINCRSEFELKSAHSLLQPTRDA